MEWDFPLEVESGRGRAGRDDPDNLLGPAAVATEEPPLSVVVPDEDIDADWGEADEDLPVEAGLPVPSSAIQEWEEDLHPRDRVGAFIAGVHKIPDVHVSEPPTPGGRFSSGMVIREPDGRMWVFEPKGHFGGYEHTFPKGMVEPHLTPQQNAHKELAEETGLTAQITGHLGDYKGTTGITRYYTAVRTGGRAHEPDPSPFVPGGRESASVKLVTPEEAQHLLNMPRDKQVLADALALHEALWEPPVTVEAILEAAVYQSELHPRWPKGMGHRGGEFMRVGEHFMHGGKEWEISHIVGGHVIAHVAGGKKSEMGTKAFPVAQHPEGHMHVAGITEHVLPTVPHGSKSSTGTVTLVDPYVDPDTHDPKLSLPSDSKITPEEWQRFGRLDQLVYIEVQERFGAYKDSTKTQQLVDASYQKFSKAAQQLVRSAYSSQYGSSSGKTLSLAEGQIHASTDAKLREEALALLGEHSAAVQWDLFNRTHSPDITLAHKSPQAPSWWQQKIDKGEPVFSALSHAWAYTPKFGQHGLLTPMAIRHITMSTQSAEGVKTGFQGEKEVCTPYRYVPGPKSLAVSDTDPSQNKALKWLAGATTVMAGGNAAEAVIDSVKNGTYLAPIAQPPTVTMDGAHNKTWVDPPPAAAAPDWAKALPPNASSTIPPEQLSKDVPWLKVDAKGNPVAQTGEEAGAHVGQYFMGLQGTVYWIGPDPGKTSSYPFHIFKMHGGAFTSEDFNYEATKPGYYIDAEFDIGDWLKKQEKAVGFTPADWSQSGDNKFIEEFKPGEKFTLNGTAYEVMGQSTHGQTPILDLSSGLKGKINDTYKTTYLIPNDGSAPAVTGVQMPEPPKYSDGEWVKTPFGKAQVTKVEDMPGDAPGQLISVKHLTGGSMQDAQFPSKDLELWPQQGAPSVGTTFSHEGKKATVTKILASGKVQANLKPGKLQLTPEEFAAQHSHHAVPVSELEISPEKTKLRDMQVGDLFQGSAGNQTVRPFQVVYKDSGKTVAVQNMDTGEVTAMSKHVSFRKLTPVASQTEIPHEDQPKGAPVELTGAEGIGPKWDPAKFEEGMKLTPQNMRVGTYFKSPTGMIFQKVADDETASHIIKVEGGAEHGAVIEIEHANATHPYPTMVPSAQPSSAVADYNPADFTLGAKQHISKMPVGTLFQTGDGLVMQKLADDGNVTTVHDFSDGHDAQIPSAQLADSPDASHTVLVPKTAAPSSDFTQWKQGHAAIAMVGELQTGDHFYSPSGNIVWEVTGPTDGGKVPVKTVAVQQVPGITAGPGMDSSFPAGVGVHTAQPIATELPSTPTTAAPADDSTLHGPQATAFDPSSYVEGETVKIGEMAPGTVFKTEGKKGAQFYKVSDDGGSTTNLLTGKVFPKKGHWKATVLSEKLGVSGGSSEHVSFEAVPVGHLFRSDGGTWEKTAGGKAVLVHKHGDAQPTPVGQSATFGAAKGVTAGGLDQEAFTHYELPKGAIVKTESGNTAEVLGYMHHAGGESTIHLLAVKDSEVPKGQDYTASLDTIASSDLPVTQNTIAQVVAVPPGAQEGTVLSDKATHATPYEQLVKGDTTQVGELKVGDTFSQPGYPGVMKVQQAADPVADPEANEAQTWVEDIEGPWAKTNTHLPPTTVAVLHAKAADAVEPELPAQLLDGLPEAVKQGQLKGFVPEKAGPFVFTPIGKLPQGAVAEDATGKKWLVKQPGATPVLSDGFVNYRVADPAVRLADTAQAAFPMQLAFKDWAPVLGSEMGTEAAKAAKADLVPNVAEMPLAGLHIKHGDYVQVNGEILQVQLSDNKNVKVEHVVTGKQSYLSPVTVPEKISPGHAVPVPDAAPPEKPLPEVKAEPPGAETTMTFSAKAHELKPGDKYLLAPGSMHVLTVPAHGINGSATVYVDKPTAQAAYGITPESVQKATTPRWPVGLDPVAAKADSKKQLYAEMPVGAFFTTHPGGEAVYQKVDAQTYQQVAYGTTPMHEPPFHVAESSVADYPMVVLHPEPTAVSPTPADSPVATTADMAPHQELPVPHGTPEIGNLQPFGSPKGAGGVYSHVPLKDLQVGQMFTDKSGNDLQVLAHDGATTIYRDVHSDKQFEAPGAGKVKLTAPPPEPGPHLKPVLHDLVAKYGSLEHVPKLHLSSVPTSTGGTGKNAPNPRLGHLKYGDVAVDADGHKVVFLASWLNRALVLDQGAGGQPKLADAGLRVKKSS